MKQLLCKLRVRLPIDGLLSKSYFKTICISRRTHSSDNFRVNIGDVTLIRTLPKNFELVPVNYGSEKANKSQSLLHHLRWMMQKDKLSQDIFLIGPPGALKRTLAMQYLELTKKEVEYISLSRDTTESDIKQRREIKDKTAHYVDQCAVRAAIEGRTLILDGIEKAERNVLPILNNLLENREMQLEDGRFLMAANRYDKLLQTYTKDEMDKMNLVRVSEAFQVIGLGLPVPRYRGNPLDPPLRSRFQARDINPLPFQEHLEILKSFGPSVPEDRLILVLSAAYTLNSSESKSLGLPDFPLDQLPSLVKMMEKIPGVSLHQLINLVYPHELFLGKEGQVSVSDAFSKFDIYPEKVGKTPEINVSMEDSSSGLDSHIVANVAEKSRKTLKYKVLAGTSKPKSSSSVDENFVDTKYLKHLFAEIMHSHTVKDFCLIGPKGCGKSAMIKKFADSLGYESELITLYTDMTARDLLQQRITHPNGDTDWKFAPLVMAALNGNLAILDGLHRINAGTLSVIHRLVHDREVQLFSGDRLLRADRYDKMKHHNEWTDEDLRQKGIYRIHPAFRLVALSEPPVIGSSTQQWLNAELLTLFFFHHMRPLSAEEELQVIAGVAKTDKSKIKTIVGLTHALRSANDLTLQSVASSLSLRQLIRIAKRLEMHSSESEYNAIQKACLGRFLPPLTKLALNQMLQEFNINTPQVANSSLEGFDRAITSEVKQGRVRIGSTEHDVFVTDSKAQVPDVLFYDNVQHLTVMEDMLKDFILGEHLLLVGNQGVGKNKIVDRFLYLLNRPREYIQLHRDTTIQSLTLQPTVQDGVIKYEDSPLVRAVKFGRVLVIDEADKAPTNVTCILKALVESGNMLLADGRRIMKYTDEIQGENIIQMHPNFRMIVLANRPGFPFLGNDFFGALGDIFSCHAVDNPSMESEVEMLKKYGPSVPEAVVRKLVEAFDELRSMADQGLIAYPYSTREIVNIVKHLEAYPNEALTTVVRNVFDFDPYSEEMWETLKHTLQKHGIPIGLDASRINLAKEYLLSKPTLISTWDVKRQCSENGREDAVLPVRRRKLLQKYYPDLDVVVDVMDRIDSRTLVFSEEEAHWKVPISENNIILDVAVTKNGNQMKDMIHIATGNPVQLFSMIPASRNINVLDVFRVFSYSRGAYQPKIQLAALSNKLAGHIVLHEGISNRLFLIDPLSGAVSQLEIDSLLEATGKQIISRVQGLDKGFYRMCSDLADKNMIALYQNNGRELQMMNLDSNEVYEMTLPFAISNIKLASPDHWLVVDRETNRKHLIKKPSEQDDARLLYNINEQPPSDVMSNMSTEGLSPDSLKTALDRNVSAPNRVFNSCDSYATIAIGFPDLEPGLEVYSYQRPSKWVFPDIALHPKFVFHSGPAQIISAVPKRFHPDYKKDDIQQQLSSAHLEVVDLGDKKVRYIPIPVAQNIPPYSTWLSEVSPSHVLISGTSNDGLVSVDAGGGVRLWETAVANLTSSLDSWMKIRGTNENEKLQLTVDAPAPDLKDLDDPKHGKIDPKNVPHVGGSMWAGGTGGRSTAGLGGIGGPYRLDAGHDVHQVPDYVKENVPEEVKRAAREMGQRAYKERLRQIKMSEYDAELYEQLISNIKLHIQSLKVILDSLQAKSKERQWLKHQTYGELDDLKLIDSLTGEKSVFKRRGDKEPEMGAPQEKPKRLKLLVDVSGSMYRFNGYDGRLHRIMESALLVMEAFEKYNDKFQYDIVGHSGEEYALPFVTQNNVPANNKEKLDILKQMHAHAQFCMSGDHTLEAIVHATESMSKEDADERFVIILSDANLDRYGIRPKSLTKVLMTNSDVNAFAIFIGSLGDQAARLQKALPSGRGFVCLDTKLIPDILRQIFTSSLLQK